ncbi:MAG: hypothetical protein ACT4QG_05615 [Sporichthyaceae bacterium]
MSAASDDGAPSDLGNALGSFPKFAQLPDSSTLDLPLVFEGTISQITGSGMADAQVLLSAWPSSQTISAMEVGETFDPTPIARTTADGSGNYALRAEVTPLLRSLTSAGDLDVELNVFHDNRHYTYLSQVRPTDLGTWAYELTGLPTDVTDLVDSAGNVLDLTLDRAKAVVEQGLNITGNLPVGLNYHEPTAPGCTPHEKFREDVDVWETVATAVARGGAIAEVKYLQGARTESSTGASFGGTFSINGSRSRITGFFAEFDPQASTRTKAVNLEYKVLTKHSVTRRACATDFQGGKQVLFLTSPSSAKGEDVDGTDITPSRFPLFDCDKKKTKRTRPVFGSRRFGTTMDRAATYGGAFNFEPVEGSGFIGNALSGYSEAIEVAFSFPESSNPKARFWCGNSGPPRSGGQRVQGVVN